MYRVVGARFQIPSQETLKRVKRASKTSSFQDTVEENDDDIVSNSIDEILQKEEEKRVEDEKFKKLRELDWEVDGRSSPVIRKKGPNVEKRNYLRKLFASTNNKLNAVTVTKLEVPRDLDVEEYFEAQTPDSRPVLIDTVTILEMKHVEIEELEFDLDDGTFEMRMNASTVKKIEEKSNRNKWKQRKNAFIGVLMLCAFGAFLMFASEALKQKTDKAQEEHRMNGTEAVKGEDMSKNILQFASRQGASREKSSLEERMDSISLVENIKKRNNKE